MNDYIARHKGITARKLYGALPHGRQHLFLRLMPYSWRAPEPYVQLQLHVFNALRHDQTPIGRGASISALAGTFDDDLRDMHARFDFLVEVAGHALEQGFSFGTAEWLVWAQLSLNDVCIEETRASKEMARLPVLKPSDGFVIAPALSTMKTAVDELLRTSAESYGALPTDEARAAIRLLQLYSLYQEPIDTSNKHRLRFEFFLRFAQPAWLRLIHLGHANGNNNSYGFEAVSALANLLREKADEASAQAPLVEPTIIREVEKPNRLTHLVVSDRFPPARNEDDQLQLKAYEVLRERMPVAPLPAVSELQIYRALLLEEFPWAATAVNGVFDELIGRRRIGMVKLHFQPILLTGPAGCGKTHLARRIADILELECYVQSLGGATDAMAILGTSRGWSSGHPSPLLRPLLKRNATVLICLDEIDKAADSTRNSPSVQNSLLSLLDPGEARRWRDVYLQTECDLSTYVYVLTCNSTIWLSAALRSRLREFEIRRPTRAELVQVSPFVVTNLEREWELPLGTFSGMNVEQYLPSAMSSLRDLRHAVSAGMRHWMSLPEQLARH